MTLVCGKRYCSRLIPLKSNYVGFTDNYEIKFHIQSYFLVIKNEGINLAFAYFKKNGIISDFNKVVMTYEIGLSQYMLKKGQRPKALFNATKYNKGGKINITIQFAEELIKDGFPFIKRKLLLKNFRKQEADYLKQLGFDLQQDYIQVVKKYHPSFEFHFD